MSKKEPSYTAGRNASYYNHYGKQYGGFLKIDLPCNPAIPFPGIYPKECGSGYNKGTCTPICLLQH
jgi:hypothetical protein